MITSTVVAFGLLIGLLFIDALIALAAVVCLVVPMGHSQSFRDRASSQWPKDRGGLKLATQSAARGSWCYTGCVVGWQSTHIFTNLSASGSSTTTTSGQERFLGSFPRFALEALGMVAIALLGGLIVFQQGSGAAVIPLVGVLALGAQRLLPALQQIYRGWASLKGYGAAISAVLEIISQPLQSLVTVTEPLPLQKDIRLEGVYFGYEPDQAGVLRGLNLEIRRGERIGLIGSTGCGKSTTVDLLWDCCNPRMDVCLSMELICTIHHPERLSAGAAIAHVPQNIYLADSSIAENIAFGVPREKIDLTRVKQAALQAQIASFIESSSEGYETFVGERGIRLSGGQRQRIGIARALYKNAQVLVLDEATSALDVDTEKALMTAVNQLSRDLTIVMIAHRLSTMQLCHRVIRLAEGAVSADGPPHHILSSSI